MARKKQTEKPKKNTIPNAYIAGAGVVEEEKITDTLEKNYMPYAMSVIISRALPEIDGFKPSHRKLLYTMYKMGPVSYTHLDVYKRQLLIQATENRFWIALLEPIADVYRKWIDAALQSANDFVKAQLQAEHQALFHALQNNDYAACEAAIDRHYDYVDAELSKSSK